MASSSNVTATNGQIDVNGQPIQFRGINIYADNLLQEGAADVTNTFPGINFLRVNVFDLNADSAAALTPYVDQLTSSGVVVEIEDHNYPTVLTGSSLQTAAQWYSSLATAFKGNSNVIFGTQNEPDLSSGWGAVDTEISTIYNAIRSTGNQNLILMNAAGGFTTSGLNPSTYASMTNVAWDLHFYNWMANNSTNVTTNAQALQSEVAGAEATDNVPVVIGEYGNSSGALGAVDDPGGMQVVQAVQQSGFSSAAWAWTSGDPTFPLLLNDPYGNPSDGLTQFGQVTQQFIAAGSKAPPSTGGGTSTGGGATSTGSGSSSTTYITPGTGTFTDAAGNTYTLDASGNALENGSPIPGGSGTKEMAYANGTVYGEDGSTSQCILEPEHLGGSRGTACQLWYLLVGNGIQLAACHIGDRHQHQRRRGGHDDNHVDHLHHARVPGTFKDAAGNSYTLDASGNALENGSVIPGGSGTKEMAYANGTVYGEDGNTSQWYSWNQSTWTAAAAPPAASSGSTTSGTGASAPPATPVTTGTGTDTLVLNISEDAYSNGDATSDANGDAAFTVSVDGKQLAGTFYAVASHAAGASQTFTFKGNWAPGSHTVAVNFVNDASGGTATTDRNLYVNDVTYDGTDTKQTATLYSAGVQNFNVTDTTALPPTVTGAGSDTLVIKLSEDAYKGDAQFTVQVDGKQLGGTFTATTLHSSGGSQAFAFAGDFGAGSHTVTVTFLNDLYAGTVSTDRNLYVNDVIYNGVDTAKSASLLANGSKAFAVTGGTTPSVAETSDHGSLSKNLSQTGTYKVGGDTFVLTSGNAATVTLGSGTSQIKFLGAGSVTLTGGSGQATVSSDLGSNSFVAGSGSLDVTGGAGKDAYTYHSASGTLVVEDFSLAKGDTLTIDKSLQASFHEGSDEIGGSMLTFGSTTHGIDLHGMASLASSNIHWV